MRSIEWYQQELKGVKDEQAALSALDKKFNYARAVLFLVGVVLLGLGWAADDRAPMGAGILWWCGWFSLALFFVVVTVHEAYQRKAEALSNRSGVLNRLTARVERRWENLPVWSPTSGSSSTDLRKTLSSSNHAQGVADDLDLFGTGSLMQLVSMAYTGPGLRTLASWLTGAALSSQAQARSAAAKSLVSDRASRVRFYELARLTAGSAAEPDAFASWATGKRWLDDKRWLVVWSWLSPVLVVVLFLIGLLAWPARATEDGLDQTTPAVQAYNVAGGILLATIPIAINVLLTVWTSGPIHSIFARAVSRRGDIEGYTEMFSSGEALPQEPELVGEIRGRLVSSEGSAAAGMRALGTVATLVASRRGGVSYVVFLILQLLCMWDVHLLGWLESWQKRYGRFANDWLTSLGELEAIQSLAALYDDYPDWATPTWIDANDQAMVRGSGLGHPLLKDHVRVRNDVSIGPRDSLLLVTGSNMSGKSTMLRSVGLNVVMAGAGAPVCASEFVLPSVELATSIRVRDSLKEGVSFYMAELHRLRDVVEHARSLGDQPDRKVLYLLDEILQGTNSRERSVAVVRVLKHLLESGAIGAISTHDLELAEDPQLESVANVVHFRELIEVTETGEETMTFDYRMRPGVTPTTNALRLLELVGLGERKVAAPK